MNFILGWSISQHRNYKKNPYIIPGFSMEQHPVSNLHNKEMYTFGLNNLGVNLTSEGKGSVIRSTFPDYQMFFTWLSLEPFLSVKKTPEYAFIHSTLFSLCFSGKWQMCGGHFVLFRQAECLHWLMHKCTKKKWAIDREPTNWNGDILISTASKSRV